METFSLDKKAQFENETGAELVCKHNNELMQMSHTHTLAVLNDLFVGEEAHKYK